MSELGLLATELRTSERTLRRAANRGMIRVRRQSPRRRSLAPGELDYLTTHWPLLSRLVSELRTLPNVRLAVLYGSTARGDDDTSSDVDLLVRFAADGLRARALVGSRLEETLGQRIQLVTLSDAPPLLLADVLRDGRLLVDRDGDWLSLKAREADVVREAHSAGEALDRDVRAALGELGVTA